MSLPPLWEPQLQGGAAGGVGGTLPSSTWQAQGQCSGRGECQHQGQPPSGSADVPWQVGGLRPGAMLSQPLGSGGQTPSGGRRGGWIGVGSALGSRVHQAVFSQGDQDDRSYKQCRTSSPSSTGSLSLGRYTPTSRSPQHYSRPGTCPPRPLLPPGSCASCGFSSYESVSYFSSWKNDQQGVGLPVGDGEPVLLMT